MADLKERLLPPKPQSAVNLRDASYRASASGRQPFQGMDLLGLKKRGQGLRSWIRVDTSGNSQIIEVDKFTMMRRCDLPARDLRLLDPLFVYPSTILGREKAIVVNLEQIRCIITADEVLLLNSLDSYVLQYVVELQRRLTSGVGEVWQSEGPELNRRRSSRSFDNSFGSTSPDYLPFEFRALEVALEAACTFLDSQAAELEIEAYPLLDELTSKISTLNLERVRRLKSRLVALTRRVQKLKEYIDDTEDFINIQLDNVRNQLIQFELLLTTATFVVAIFGVVAGIFGMNFAIPLFDDPGAFKWVLIVTGICGIIIFCAFVWFFKYRRLMPL
ncbi:Magnesium transporter 2 isoform 2 [Theobroma cacao]|uniref:Magnesium transporter n=1 Tax=Theobroma cacao TaxID=3641 RepID=A0A061GGA9_THECC|nr:Magnesium transporter 2 isoform 2 [Theobroma cacao]